MKSFNIILVAVLAAIISSYAIVKLTVPQPALRGKVLEKESAYDRVIRTNTIRCGYGLSPPQLMKDSNTGKITGMDYDIWQAIGKQLGLTIEWTEEAGWGNFIEGLRTGRYDAFCSDIWPDYARSKFLTLSDPVVYSALLAYARVDDKRFDGNLGAIDQASVTIPAIDGDVSVMMAETHFPHAKILVLPQTATVSDMFLSITTKKADVMFFTGGMFAEFEKENKGALRPVKDVPPPFTQAAYYSFNVGEYQLRDMVNLALRRLIDDGQLEKIAHSYAPDYIVGKKNYEDEK